MKALTKLSATFVLISSLITPPMTTWAASPVQQEGQTLAAQVSITRDMLAQMLAQLQRETENRVAGGSHPDFLAKSREFNARVALAMEIFEKKMAEGPLKKAGLWVDRIRSIHKSDIYTPDQKEALIADQMKQAKQQFEILSTEYQGLLRDLYFVAAPQYRVEVAGVDINRTHKLDLTAPMYMSLNFVPGRTESATAKFRVLVNDPVLGTYQSEVSADWNTLVTEEGQREPHSGQGAHNFNGSAASIENAKAIIKKFEGYGALPVKFLAPVKTAFFEKVIRNGCYTSSCLALFSSQLSSFVTLVRATLDKPIEFVMTPNGVRPPLKEKRWSSDDDGSAAVEAKILRLVPLNLAATTVSAYYGIDRSLDTGLPFQMTDGEYRQAWQTHLNAQLIDKNADYKVGCPITVTQLANFACRSDNGCMNESERSMISSAIESADLGRSEKARRQACLKSLKQ